MNNEIEFLKQQIVAKDEMISFLKAQLVSLQKTSGSEVVKQPFIIEDYLNVTCKHAINFEDLFYNYEPYMYNCKMNKWIQIGGYNEDLYMVFKYIEVGYYPKTDNWLTDMFCSVFNKIEHTSKPIFCSNVKKGTYYYKTNDKWELIEDRILFKLIYNKLITLCSLALRNTKEFSNKYPTEFFKYYKKDKQWYFRNSAELSLATCYNAELDNFSSICHSKLSNLSSRKQVKFVESAAHNWNEFKDQKNNESESDDDE